MSYTKGPWTFIKDDDWEIVAGNDAIMGNTTYYPWVPYEADDWHLIAAAPELLEALIDIADDYSERFDMDSPSTNPGMKQVVAAARAAIAKAKGEVK